MGIEAGDSFLPLPHPVGFSNVFFCFMFPPPVFSGSFLGSVVEADNWKERDKNPFAYLDAAYPALSWSRPFSLWDVLTYIISLWATLLGSLEAFHWGRLCFIVL